MYHVDDLQNMVSYAGGGGGGEATGILGGICPPAPPVLNPACRGTELREDHAPLDQDMPGMCLGWHEANLQSFLRRLP